MIIYGNKMNEVYVTHREQCPSCAKEGGDSSKNNLIVYSNGGKHCFACDYTEVSEDYKNDSNQIYEHEDKVSFGLKEWSAIKEYTKDTGCNFRGIDDETYRTFGVRHQYTLDAEDNPTLDKLIMQYYPLTNNDLNLCGVKVRAIPKKFFAKGSNKYSTTQLFGQVVFNKSISKNVLILSGEIDLLSAYQMMKNLGAQCPAMVSSTVGEGGFKQFQSQYEFLNKFEKIIVVPDRDKAGKEALEKLSQVLPRDKMFVVELPKKDTNEMLMNGLEDDFIDRYFKAKPYIPDGIVGSSALFDKLKETAFLEKVPLPPFMYQLEEALAGGFTLESIINIISASGQGKSTYVNELIYYWIFNSPYRVGIVSLELSSGQYANALLSRHLGNKLNLMTTDELKPYLESDVVLKGQAELFTTEEGLDRFYLIEDRSSKLETIKQLIEQLIIGCDCKIIVLDPLQDLFAGASLEQQEQFIAWQKIMIKLYKIIIVNVNHTRKSANTKESGSMGNMISEEDIMGTSSIYKSGSINILFTRNKLAEDALERNTTKVYMSKNRNTGTTGHILNVIYDNSSHTLYNEEDYKSMFPQMFAEDEVPEELKY